MFTSREPSPHLSRNCCGCTKSFIFLIPAFSSRFIFSIAYRRFNSAFKESSTFFSSSSIAVGKRLVPCSLPWPLTGWGSFKSARPRTLVSSAAATRSSMISRCCRSAMLSILSSSFYSISRSRCFTDSLPSPSALLRAVMIVSLYIFIVSW